jgi:hypothetical protein
MFSKAATSLLRSTSRRGLSTLTTRSVPFRSALLAAPTSERFFSTASSSDEKPLPPLAGGERLAYLAEECPHRDVVQYEHKNRVWSLHHVHYYSEGLAIGLMENGFVIGDKVLSLMPEHFQDTVRTCYYGSG